MPQRLYSNLRERRRCRAEARGYIKKLPARGRAGRGLRNGFAKLGGTTKESVWQLQNHFFSG